MRRILIVSDTHGFNENLAVAVKHAGKFDYCFHLGDSEVEAREIESYTKCPTYIVSGNNDFFQNYLKDMELEFEGHRIFLTHGHYHHVSFTTDVLVYEAMDRGCDIALFGHTHRPCLEEISGVTVVNPGSLTYPRQEGRRPTFAVMELSEGKKPEVLFYQI